MSAALACTTSPDKPRAALASPPRTGPLAWAACTNLTINAPNALVQESVRAFYSGWYKELAQNLPVVEDGHISLPDGAGMITELKPEVFERADAVVRRTE